MRVEGGLGTGLALTLWWDTALSIVSNRSILIIMKPEEQKHSSTLCIFDIDGTLTPPRKVSSFSSTKPIEQEMRTLISELK